MPKKLDRKRLPRPLVNLEWRARRMERAKKRAHCRATVFCAAKAAIMGAIKSYKKVSYIIESPYSGSQQTDGEFLSWNGEGKIIVSYKEHRPIRIRCTLGTRRMTISVQAGGLETYDIHVSKKGSPKIRKFIKNHLSDYVKKCLLETVEYVMET